VLGTVGRATKDGSRFVVPHPSRTKRRMEHPQICCTSTKSPAAARERRTEECKAQKPVF
jgi:hypothetical protein